MSEAEILELCAQAASAADTSFYNQRWFSTLATLLVGSVLVPIFLALKARLDARATAHLEAVQQIADLVNAALTEGFYSVRRPGRDPALLDAAVATLYQSRLGIRVCSSALFRHRATFPGRFEQILDAMEFVRKTLRDSELDHQTEAELVDRAKKRILTLQEEFPVLRPEAKSSTLASPLRRELENIMKMLFERCVRILEIEMSDVLRLSPIPWNRATQPVASAEQPSNGRNRF